MSELLDMIKTRRSIRVKRNLIIKGSEKWGEESVQLATTIISTVSVVCNIYLIFYIRKMN